MPMTPAAGEQAIAPIALFAYNRPRHLQRTVEALRSNHLAAQSDLFVFCDSAKTSDHEPAAAEVRAVARSIAGFRSVEIIERPQNWGLAKSIVDGVSTVCGRFGRTIVLEDDMVTSPWFLAFMNDGLDRYRDDDRVASIHGYCYPVDETLPRNFFLRGADCWGWATWSRAWQLFEADGSKLLRALQERGLLHEFDLDGAFSFSQMLQNQIDGKNDSWAVRWHASCFLRERLTLYPGRSLVQNIGNDASGTHSANTEQYRGSIAAERIAVEDIKVEQSGQARDAFARFLRSTRPSPLRRMASGFARRLGLRS
jgi:hypothetical protein